MSYSGAMSSPLRATCLIQELCPLLSEPHVIFRSYVLSSQSHMSYSGAMSSPLRAICHIQELCPLLSQPHVIFRSYVLSSQSHMSYPGAMSSPLGGPLVPHVISRSMAIFWENDTFYGLKHKKMSWQHLNIMGTVSAKLE
jgi:hypothetical protein